MVGFKYFYTKGLVGARAACDCSFNEVADSANVLYKADPTKKPDRKGFVWWTEADSKKLGIDHEKLKAYYEMLETREAVCSSNNVAPGCEYEGTTCWFVDQTERIRAFLEKRAPHLDRWSFRGADNLARMGIEVTSPFPLSRRDTHPPGMGFDPAPHYHYSPSSPVMSFKQKTESVPLSETPLELEIPLDDVDFVQIDKAENPNGKLIDVSILVTHSNGNSDFYILHHVALVVQIVVQKKNVPARCDVIGSCPDDSSTPPKR